MPWSPQDGSLISRLCPVGGRAGPEATQKGKGSQCGGQYPNLQMTHLLQIQASPTVRVVKDIGVAPTSP